MNEIENTNLANSKQEDIAISDEISLNADLISNVVLKRLIDEVKNEKENNVTAYNRLHNRHNRSR